MRSVRFIGKSLEARICSKINRPSAAVCRVLNEAMRPDSTATMDSVNQKPRSKENFNLVELIIRIIV
jgi:hypothetical protein